MPVIVLVAVFASACGGGGSDSLPLIAAGATGAVNGQEFTVAFGASGVLESGTVSTVVGTGAIGCDDLTANEPPGNGIYVLIQIPEAVVGVASEHFFNFYVIENGNLNGSGSSNGSVEVTAASETTLAMTVSYSDTIGDDSYAIDGSFEVMRCP